MDSDSLSQLVHKQRDNSNEPEDILSYGQIRNISGKTSNHWWRSEGKQLSKKGLPVPPTLVIKIGVEFFLVIDL